MFSPVTTRQSTLKPARIARDAVLLFIVFAIILSSYYLSQVGLHNQSSLPLRPLSDTQATASATRSAALTFTPVFESPPNATSPSSLHFPNPNSLHSQLPDHCILIGSDPSRNSPWLENSRALCLTTSICLRNRIERKFYRIHNRTTTCALSRTDTPPNSTDPAARFQRRFSSCEAFRRSKVVCAYGINYIFNRDHCPEEHTLGDTDLFAQNNNNNTVRWLDELTVLVPEYPYRRNIYHYSAAISHVAFVAAHLEELLADWRRTAGTRRTLVPSTHGGMPRTVNFVFRDKHDNNGWQQGFFQALFEGLIPSFGYQPRVQFLGRLEANDTTCIRNAVQMGFFGDVNAWPFANGSEVALDGRSVPAEALQVREAVYRASGVESLEIGSAHNGSLRKTLRTPPLVVRYARRMGREDLSDAVGNNVKGESIGRVFTVEDEKWFGKMLREEVEGRGLELRVGKTRNTETFAEQVRAMADVGLVIGIHGANLVNSMFMPPFGGMVEIFPYGAVSRCYQAGMNSGLAYWTYQATEAVGGFRCTERGIKCQLKYRNQNIYLGNASDRKKVRILLREAVTHLMALHRKFPAGVPVRLDKNSGRYIIADSA